MGLGDNVQIVGRTLDLMGQVWHNGQMISQIFID